MLSINKFVLASPFQKTKEEPKKSSDCAQCIGEVVKSQFILKDNHDVLNMNGQSIPSDTFTMTPTSYNILIGGGGVCYNKQ